MYDRKQWLFELTIIGKFFENWNIRIEHLTKMIAKENDKNKKLKCLL